MRFHRRGFCNAVAARLQIRRRAAAKSDNYPAQRQISFTGVCEIHRPDVDATDLELRRSISHAIQMQLS
jgi:hypothetical protein